MRKDDLHAAFAAERRAFPAAKGVRLRIVARHFAPDAGFRDLAWYESDNHEIFVVSRLCRLSRENILGVLRHELGHAVDPDLSEPGAEQRADDIAHAATGARICYDARGVQTIAPGLWPRPLHLHT